MATVTTRRKPESAPERPATLADLLRRLESKSNTKAEIARKLEEYFAAGTRLAWVVDPKSRTVRVHTEPRESVALGVDGVLDGGDVLRGLRLPVRDVFEIGE